MASDVYIYDPTERDTLSKVRGIGRYLQILKENFSQEFNFVSDVSNVPADSVFINTFYNPVQNPLITKRIAKRQIATIHDVIPLKYPSHFPVGLKGMITVFKNKRLLNLYDHFVTVSETSKHDLISILKIPAEKITVVYPCVPESFTFQTPAPLPNSFPKDFFLYVGDVTWNKNIVMIAKALKKANAHCVFVGNAFTNMHTIGTNPWLKELRAFAHEVRDYPRFIFPGYVENEVLTSLYKNALANIFISHDEGFGFSYIEAASQKTPSILSDIPVFHEVAGTHALFVNNKDEEMIAQAISAIRDSSEHERAKLGNDAYVHISKYKNTEFKQSLQTVIKSLT